MMQHTSREHEMTSQHIRTFGFIVGLVALLGLASVAAAAPLSDQ